MVRRTSSAPVCVAVAVAFTSSWYVSAQSSRQPSLSASSRATPAAADTAFYVSRDKAVRLAAVYAGNPKTGQD